MTVEEMIAERDKAKQKRKRLEDMCQEIGREIGRLDGKIFLAEKREQLLPLMGVVDGVQLANCVPAGDRQKFMNDTLGTLTEIRGVRCSVDYGPHKIWNMYLSSIIPASEKQGATFDALLSGDVG